jgi:hypothetical protein
MTQESPLFDSVAQAFAAVILQAVTSRAATPPHEVENAVRAEAERIASQNAARVVDTASRRWLSFCSLVLASYRNLLPLVAESRTALSILQSAMTGPLKAGIKAYIADRFGISQDAPEAAFEHVAETFQARGEERFGQAFTYVADVRNDKHSFTNVTKCFFNDFFRANGAPEVTPVFCAMDAVWAEEMDDPRYGVRFERPTTLAAGDDACRFQFSRRSTRQGAA